MLRFRAPRRPSGFQAVVRDAAARVEDDVAAGRVPVFEDVWTRYKAEFVRAQQDKCGYCEVSSLNHPGAVEHYAPKGAVHELTDAGTELAPTASVSGRKTRLIASLGYWWLAYSWDNWLFVCERCNSGWKRSLFPVRDRPRTLPPTRGDREAPLLLHPFGPLDPIDHLEFSRLGQVAARGASEHGAATIETCGLDRESLRRARERVAADAYRHIDRLLAAIARGPRQRAHDAVVDLLSLGDDDRPHAGMVRSIVKTQLGRRWTEMKAIERALRKPGR